MTMSNPQPEYVDETQRAVDEGLETASERAQRVVAEAEAKLCECDRPDEADNPHRHEKDMACVYWLAGDKPDRDKVLAAFEELKIG